MKKKNSYFAFVFKDHVFPKSKRSQAAMEFLMTYGWAILAAIIAVGVLAYFGVFTPGKYITGSAIVNAPFYVNAWSVNTTGVTMEIKNNGANNYNIKSVNVEGCGVYIGAPDTVGVNDLTVITATCILEEGKNFKGDVTITYTKSNSEVELTSTGRIVEKIVA